MLVEGGGREEVESFGETMEEGGENVQGEEPSKPLYREEGKRREEEERRLIGRRTCEKGCKQLRSFWRSFLDKWYDTLARVPGSLASTTTSLPSLGGRCGSAKPAKQRKMVLVFSQSVAA